MNRSILIIVLFLILSATTMAYTYEIDSGYFSLLELENYETLLMTGGGGHDLYLLDYSYARIENTAPLVEFSGGIWNLTVADNSHLDFLGGGANVLPLFYSATATLSGGRLDEIRSYQYAWKWYYPGEPDPPVLVPNPHIEIICRPDYQLTYTSGKVTGVSGSWLDFSTFNISLVNVTGYSPAIENIKFTIIPEPATLALFAFAVLLLRRK